MDVSQVESINNYLKSSGYYVIFMHNCVIKLSFMTPVNYNFLSEGK